MSKNLLDYGTLPLLSLRNVRKVHFDNSGRADPTITRERRRRLERSGEIRERRKARRSKVLVEGVVPLLELLSLVEEGV